MINFPNDFTALPEGWHVETTPTIGLRDYIAGLAMQGDWASQDISGNGVFMPSMDDEALLEHAKFYYRMADAMLKAREGK